MCGQRGLKRQDEVDGEREEAERQEAEMIRTREAWWINEVGDSGKK